MNLQHAPSAIRIELPQHLRTLAAIRGHETSLEVSDFTLRGTLDALEAAYPMLRGTIRDQFTGQRRPFLRFFACEEDLSHLPLETLLPPKVRSGQEPLIILGAIVGG
jgi:molybdopterin synthase sulfur carrier subunit